MGRAEEVAEDRFWEVGSIESLQGIQSTRLVARSGKGGAKAVQGLRLDFRIAVLCGVPEAGEGSIRIPAGQSGLSLFQCNDRIVEFWRRFAGAGGERGHKEEQRWLESIHGGKEGPWPW